MSNSYDCIVVGGGASGFFFAINYATNYPNKRVLILEKSKHVLQKVRISGGGRCNVTHAEFLPIPLSAHYPRGEKELISPFHQFMTGDMMAWLDQRGVQLKIEDDGRIFPVSDSSQTIIDCFLKESNKLGIEVITSENVLTFDYENTEWNIKTNSHNFKSNQLVISTGSSKKIWEHLQFLGHHIIPPVPSLFTFNIDFDKFTSLQGLSLHSHIKLYQDKACQEFVMESEGATLITHWGLSGPCVLKLSAWGATYLNDLKYKCYLCVNWLPNTHKDDIISELRKTKELSAKKNLSNQVICGLPKRFWIFILGECHLDLDKNWAQLSKKNIHEIADKLTNFKLEVNGKSTFKEEFVTAGGVDLKEIDFKTFSSKKLPQLKIIGEALNIDAITGGFNFQNAWTSAYIAAK